MSSIAQHIHDQLLQSIGSAPLMKIHAHKDWVDRRLQHPLVEFGVYVRYWPKAEIILSAKSLSRYLGGQVQGLQRGRFGKHHDLVLTKAHPN